MTEFEVDEEYIEEVNTSYDQDKEIGSIPSAYFAHSQPMNAKNGGDEKFKSREKLNKDGTGVRKAKRGVNPNNTPAKVLEFVYVSKSECEICRQYDGQMFATDSPNRPIIPRLESQGKKGTRPYTHPNCKCKWVRPFSKTGLKNFGQTRGGEAEAYELKQKTIDMARKTIVDFDKLSKRDQYVAIAYMFKERLSSPESFDPTSLPIASMLKMTYDAIEPTLALQLAKMSSRDSNEVRNLIDDMVGESLSSERKHKIVLEHNLDFTFENLLKLTVNALIENLNEEKEIGMDVEMEFTDDEEKAKDTVEDHLEEDPEHYSRLKSVFEHDVWDENTNTLVDPTLLEDKKQSDKSESDEGEFGFTDDEWNGFPEEVQDQLTTKVFKKEGLDDEEPYMPDVYGIDPYPHRHEFIDNVCIICDYVLKASESLILCPKCGSYAILNSELGSEWNKCDSCGEEFIEGAKPLQGQPTSSTNDYNVPVERDHAFGWDNVFPAHNNESKANEGGRGSGRKGHQKWMLGAEADPEECPHCMIFTEKKNGNCQICGNSY
jgi:hypothetical protein